MNTEEKIIKARAGLVLTAPFFASLALKLKLVSDSSCQTMWTDGISMGYNPEFVKPLPLDEVKGLICHEVMHVACNHNTRRDERDFKTWNIACDYAIDPIVKNAGFDQPWETINHAYHNWEAERIYNDFYQNNDTDNENDTEQDNQNQYDNNSQPNPPYYGEVRDFPGHNGKASTAEKRQAEAAQKIAVKQAAQIAQAQGTLPYALERFISDITQPQIPWCEVLARFLTEHTKNDYSWSKPNRRYMFQGLYLPELQNPELGLIVLFVDTSGSISQKELNEFAAEMQGILAAYRTELLVLYVDAAVQGYEFLSSDDTAINLELKGGGGTDFRPGYEWLKQHDYEPTAAIYLTDGYCNTFPDEGDFPTLWVLTQKSGYFKPPFGETLVIYQND